MKTVPPELSLAIPGDDEMGSRMVATRLYTVQDLERMTSDEAERYELYAGVLREVEAMGGWHGEIGVELTTVRTHQYRAFRRLGIRSLKDLLRGASV